MASYSIRTRVFITFTLAILLTIPFVSSSSISRHSAAQTVKPDNSKGEVRHPNAPPKFVAPPMEETPSKPHILAASYYSVEGNLSATLTLNNKGPKTLEVQPILFSLTGERFDVPSVTVEGNSHRVINLREYSIAGTLFQEGSLQVVYWGKDLEMGAQVKLVDAERGLIFDEQLVEPAAMFASSRLEGVWWLQSRKCDIRLVLSNTTDTVLSVSASVDGTAPRQKETMALSLQPHETRVMNVQRDLVDKRGGTLKEVGGVSIEHSGAKGALLSRAMIQDATTGYSAVVEFVDPQKAKSSKLHGAGLRVGAAGGEHLIPVVVARNIGSTPTVVRGRIPYITSDGSTNVLPLPELRLSPGETRLVNVAAALKRGQIVLNLASSGLEFEYSGEPDSVVMSAQSVSQSGNQVFRVPLIDPATQPSSTGGYPWRIEGDSSTVVYIKNVTDQPREYNLQLNFNGGVYAPGLKTVAAGQTVALDIRHLRDNQVPDAHGQMIPLEATNGQVHWSLRGPSKIVLIGRAEQADVSRGMSSSYACANCCGDSFDSGWVDPGYVEGTVDGITTFFAIEQDRNCYGSLLSPFLVNYPSWSSSDPSVASCDSNGVATALNPGSTNIDASWTVYQRIAHPESGNNECVDESLNVLASALCTVFALPRVRSVTQQIIDESSQGSEVVECGRFKVFTEYETGCPFGTGQETTHNLTGHIQEDAILLSEQIQKTADDGEKCTYKATREYRMKNRLDQSIGTGFTSYKAVVTWSGRTASKNGPGLSTRATIPGVGPCP